MTTDHGQADGSISGSPHYCRKCKRPLPALARFCNRCGTMVAEAGPGDRPLAISMPVTSTPSSPARGSPVAVSQAFNSLVALDRSRGESAPPAATGTLFAGRYRIGRVAGRGGMGVVYEAADANTGGSVALKILLPGLMKDQGVLARFRDQVYPLSVLRHENIVELLDAGSTGDVAYIVMPFMPGGTLRDVVRSRRRARPNREDMRRVAAFARQAASGLAYAHKYVVHRDLKPENILVDAAGSARIADFDLAKFRRASPLTMTGDSMGTAYYMAPEQIRDPSRVDGRADLFSLGVVMYETVSGELPVGAFRPLSRVVAGCPGDLDRIVLKLLSPDPSDRFADAFELEGELASLEAGLA